MLTGVQTTRPRLHPPWFLALSYNFYTCQPTSIMPVSHACRLKTSITSNKLSCQDMRNLEYKGSILARSADTLTRWYHQDNCVISQRWSPKILCFAPLYSATLGNYQNNFGTLHYCSEVTGMSLVWSGSHLGVCVWGGGEDTPWYKLYRYVQPQRVGFLCRFGLKIGIDFAHVCLESGMVFKGTTGVYECIYCFYSKTVRKKVKYVNLKWILRILFCWRSNLSNNDIISQRPGLETGVKMTFLVWNRVRIWRTRQHTPTKISKRAPISREK